MSRLRKLSRFLSFKYHYSRAGGAKQTRALAEDSLAALRDLIVQPIDIDPAALNQNPVSIENQYKLLTREYCGQSELLLYHAKLVVLLRRGIQVDKNIITFDNLWLQQGDFLLTHLSLRWLVSASNTFVDNSPDPVLRSICMAAAALSNTAKLYETERLLLRADANPDDPNQARRIDADDFELYDGVTPFRIGRGDIIRNMRWRLDDVAALHPLGRILPTVFDRLQAADTVYRRFAGRHSRDNTKWW